MQRRRRPLASTTSKTDRSPTAHTSSAVAVPKRPSGISDITSGLVPTSFAIGTWRPSASATRVSPVTHSRRSDITGRLSGRCSSERFSCDSATTGTSSSLASALSEREISEISVARFSEEFASRIS